MAESKNITINIEIHGTLDADILAEEVKHHLRREMGRFGVKTEVEKPAPLKVGDFAKVIQVGHCNEGEIVEILSVDFSEDYPFDTELINREVGDCHKSEQLARATAEEVAEAKAKLAEKILAEKWAKIGRKPNEFKVGDAVRYKKAFTIVTEVKPEGIVAINQSNHISKNIEVSAEDLTLEFPAEARFE
jgi:hypothetical protein